jgi:hypothetical protein
VEAFFPKIAEFQKPPRHPKWREVNIAATLPGWTRFEVAQAWLDSQRMDPQRNPNVAPPPAEQAAVSGSRETAASRSAQPKPEADTALYQEFLRWQQLQGR